jgi:hypothetical protein
LQQVAEKRPEILIAISYWRNNIIACVFLHFFTGSELKIDSSSDLFFA